MGQDLPDVSVVIPCFNYGRYVTAAVESALRQTHAPREVIVVDDGSTDDTRTVLHCYQERIHYIYQANRGLSAARNTGIQAARGSWVAFLDADDLWLENKLRLQMECVRDHPALALVGACVQGSRRPATTDPESSCTLLCPRDLLGGMPFGASSTVARREYLLRAGLFDESRRSVEDREMWLKLARLGPVARVNVPLWIYRVHPQQMNANPGRMAENYRRVLEDFFALNPEYRREWRYAYSYFQYDTAAACAEAHWRWSALYYLVRSYCLHPWPLPQRGAENRFSRPGLLLKMALGAHCFRRLRQACRALQFLPAQPEGQG